MAYTNWSAFTLHAGPKIRRSWGFSLQAANVEDVDGVIVTREAGKVMVMVGILPGLRDGAVVERIRLVRPDAEHEARLIVLLVMEDGICATTAKVSLTRFCS